MSVRLSIALALALLVCSCTHGAKITIIGAGKGVTIMSGNSMSRVFDVSTALEIRDMTVSDGFQDFGSVSAPDDVGGAIRLLNANELLVVNCTIENNSVITSATPSINFNVKGGGAIGVVGLSGAGVTTNVTIVDTWLLDNTAGVTLSSQGLNNGGGAMLLSADDTCLILLTVETSQIDRNSVENSDGGGVLMIGNIQASISDTTFENNEAIELVTGTPISTVGGALEFSQYNSLTTVQTMTATLTRCTFGGNNATFLGGALAINEFPYTGSCALAAGTTITIDVVDSVFTDNRISRDPLSGLGLPDVGGGAVAMACEGSVVTMTGCTFMDNRVETSTLSSTQGDGGAILVTVRAELTIFDSLFERNFAFNAAGAIDVNSLATLAVHRSTFRNNTVDTTLSGHSGGAVTCDDGVTCEFFRSTFSGNSASTGGAIDILGVSPSRLTTITLSQCTIHGNTATLEDGGGILVRESGGSTVLVAVTACTIADNVALGLLSIGGISDGASASTPLTPPSLVTLHNTIVGDNVGTSVLQSVDVGFSSATTIASSGFNFIVDQTGNIGTVTVASDVTSVSTFLGPLQNNGGATETRVPASFSPAIDSGDNTLDALLLGTDQRFTGFARLAFSQVDIGAVEAQDLCVGVVCDDGDPCTVDKCLETGICSNTAIDIADNYVDTFPFMPTRTYDNSEGTLDWSPFPWLEIGDDPSGLPTAGEIQVAPGPTKQLEYNDAAVVTPLNVTRSVSRKVPTLENSAATWSMIVSLQFQMVWATQVSMDGVTFTTLECFHNGKPDTLCTAMFPGVPTTDVLAPMGRMYDVTAFTSSHMTIRYLFLEGVGGLLGGGAIVRIQDVSVTLSGVPCCDDLSCTVNDMCLSGICTGTLVVDQALECSTLSCQETNLCEAPTLLIANVNQTQCDDGNQCTLNKCSLDTGMCLPAQPFSDMTEYSDDFAGPSYSGSTGELDWTLNNTNSWIELGDDNLVASGSVRVIGGTLSFFPDFNDTRSLQRKTPVDPLLFDTATLMFRVTNSISAPMTPTEVLVEVSSDGVTFTRVACIPSMTGDCSGLGAGTIIIPPTFLGTGFFDFPVALDITPFMDLHMTVRLVVTRCAETFTGPCIFFVDGVSVGLDAPLCDDADLCTVMDMCSSGTCAGSAIDCSPFEDACNTAMCNSTTGMCDVTTLPDNTVCSIVPNGPCENPDTCQSGVCTNGGPNDALCPNVDGFSCTEEFCDPSTLACDIVLNDAVCETPGATCGVETCSPSNTMPLPDVDGCVHLASDLICTDGLFCNGMEFCNETILQCQVNTTNTANPPFCSDGIPCSTDTCDEMTDMCVSTFNDTLCDDGNQCTLDTCSGSGCTSTFLSDPGMYIDDFTPAGFEGSDGSIDWTLPSTIFTPNPWVQDPGTGNILASTGSVGMRTFTPTLVSPMRMTRRTPVDPLLTSNAAWLATFGLSPVTVSTFLVQVSSDGLAFTTVECYTSTIGGCSAYGGTEIVYTPIGMFLPPFATVIDLTPFLSLDMSIRFEVAECILPTPGLGTCARIFTQEVALDGSACDDGDACTGMDLCSSGVCAGTLLPDMTIDCGIFSCVNGTFELSGVNPALCEDSNPCTEDTCNVIDGICSNVPANPGAVCGPTPIEICEAQAVCTGVSATCPANGPTAMGTLCRASAGPCDPSEVCDGTLTACPADTLSPSSLVCRPAADICDDPETCTGGSALCPSDFFTPFGTLCRPSVGICDTEEVCGGFNPACPPDLFESSFTVCRASAGICDVPETCTGSAALCPTDDFLTGDVCRSAVGPCDIEEVCDGSGALCPADAIEANGVVCRDAADICDVSELCDGTLTSCPADSFSPASTVCRVSVGVCDTEETCSGSGPACPVDVKEPISTVCRASVDVCDVAENCDGATDDCPIDAFQNAAFVCRVAVDQCDAQETCTGSAAACPPDAPVPPFTSCDDGLFCTVNDQCDGFLCDLSDPRDCSDAVACTTDSCNEVMDACINMPNDAFCNNGAFCDGDEFCDAVTDCQSGTPVDCNDGVMCTVDQCNEITDMCFSTPSDPICDDNNVCNGIETCDSVTDCQPGTPLDCSSFDGPCSIGMCDSITGCFASPVVGGTICRASLGVCDPEEVCDGTSITCPADTLFDNSFVCRASGGVCDVAEVCDGSLPDCPSDAFESSLTVCRTSAGVCDIEETCSGVGALCPADVVQPITTSCRSIGGVCDLEEFCDGTTVLCPIDLVESAATVCRVQSGVCDIEELCDGTNNDCPSDVFEPGTTVCRASLGVCDAEELCTGTSGTCPSDVFVPASTTCRAATDVCDVEEQCDGSTALCPADQVQVVGTVCRATADICDVEEVCDGSLVTCPADGFEPSSVVCRASAGFCDAEETCSGAGPACPADVKEPTTTECRASVDVCDIAEDCDGITDDCPLDSFQASTVECRPSVGQCDEAENCTGSNASCPADLPVSVGTPCDDSLFCTVNDQCDGFLCTLSDPRDCSDAVACTTDSCNEVMGVCLNMPNDTFCNNGAFCDGAEFCDAIMDCQTGTPVDCNDGVMCTDDACNEITDMCFSTPNNTVCDDGNVCNGIETCNGVTDCQAGTPLDCSAFDGPCSVGMCDGITGCFASPLPASTICRVSLGVCDPEETCDGTATTCPVDILFDNSIVCRASGGVCDIAEVCDGASALCPLDVFESSAVVCRSAIGVCDIEETCSGSGALCPVDILEPGTTVCRVSNGTCDTEETCSGVSGLCPADAFEPIATVCRASTGICDIEETCTGMSGTCPLDAFESSATICRPASGACDIEETCTGSSDTCPADAVEAPTTVCRASVGVCDISETCDGSSVDCPADTFEPSSLVCRASIDVCDTAETCPGNGPTCPADIFSPPGAICRASTGFCDPEEQCDGTMSTCPVDVFLAPGTACNDDMNVCTEDVCTVGGTCDFIGALDCDDGVSCTDDTCLPLSGCQNTPDDLLCDDAEPCTVDTCNAVTGCSNVIVPQCNAEVCLPSFLSFFRSFFFSSVC